MPSVNTLMISIPQSMGTTFTATRSPNIRNQTVNFLSHTNEYLILSTHFIAQEMYVSEIFNIGNLQLIICLMWSVGECNLCT